MSTPSEAQGQRLSRLSTAVRVPQLHPWRKAPESPFFLYWMPVSSFPPPEEQRRWLIGFFDHFNDAIRSQFTLSADVFLQYEAAAQMQSLFTKNAPDFMPIKGWARRPGASFLPAVPGPADLKAMAASNKTLDVLHLMADHCYIFLRKDEAPQRSLFQGSGGLTLIYRDSAGKAKPLELPQLPRGFTDILKSGGFKVSDITSFLEAGSSLRDEFLAKSKVLFGAGLEAETWFSALPFIIPLWTAESLMGASQTVGQAFELFDIYVRESPEDNGILMASQKNFEKPIVKAVVAMRQQGLIYPEVGPQ